jgi:serine/threonine-protein kinase
LEVADPASPPVREGDLLAGKYRVERIIGSGGMGVVVAARHEQLDQLVALKFVRDEALGNQDAVQRFLREARAAVKLKSEHAAKVLDVGTLESGAPYMVMEFLEGRDLGQVLAEQGPLSVEAAAEWIVQACEAVAEAHASGIIHRDLKPQNLFLARSVGGASKVKVLDFGVSKSMTTSDVKGGGLTQTRAMLGSPLYMSPEQMRSSRDVDARSDVWALGVVLYELLTRRWPFEAESMPELCLKVVSDPPTPITEHRPDIPRPLAEVIGRCLQKDPAMRYENAAELAAALAPMAPAASHVIVERARMAMGSTKVSTQDRSGQRNSQAFAQTAPTPAAWGSGRGESPVAATAKKRSPVLWIGLGAGVAAALVGAVLYATHRGDDPATASTASASVPSASGVSSAAAMALIPLPSASAPPEPAASDSVVAPLAAASASAPARGPTPPAGSAKPDPTPRVTPTGRPRPVDDIPSLR